MKVSFSHVLLVIFFFAIVALFQSCGKEFRSTDINAAKVVKISFDQSAQGRRWNSADLKFNWIHGVTGSWSGYSLEVNKLNTPIGWGYMNPMLVVDGEDQYSITLTSCVSPGESHFGHVYCGYLIKNGIEIYDSGFSLGNSYSGFLADKAYQTPMLFKNGRTLYLAYWMSNLGTSMVNLISIDLDSAAPRRWVHRATYSMPSGASFNYLGGAISPNGTIIIAGLAVVNGVYSLQMISTFPPYTSFGSPVTAYTSGGANWIPLYPHVVVDQNNTIDLFFTLQNNTPCSESGTIYTSYKNVVNLRCTVGGGCQSIWSDAALDAAQDDTNSGDNCYFDSSRFPLDLIIDEKGIRYFIYLSRDLKSYKSSAKLASNASSRKQFILVSSAGLNLEMGSKFTSFEKVEQIDAMSMTKLTDGRFAIFANSRSSIMSGLKNHLNILVTRDFITFEGPYTYSTPFGVGHSIKLAQPNKNGSGAINKLHFSHGGDLYQRNGETDGNWGLIQYSQFLFYKATLP